MKLSVIIVNYNVKHYLRQCLDSVLRSVNTETTEIFVVDNHSRDGSVEYLEPRYPQVNFIASNHNLGFARANNIAIRQSKGEYVLLLNPDTILGEHTLERALTFMQTHSDAGALGVCMLKSNGEKALESRRGLPTPMTAFYKMSGLARLFPKSKVFGRYYMGYLPWDEPVEIEVISGAFCLLRREAIEKVGLIDEDFFMYGEDIDLSYRLLKGGYKNYYLPEIILHYKGESTHKSSFRYVHVFYQAMLIFFKKHYSHATFFVAIPVKFAIYLKAAMELLHRKISDIRKHLGFSILPYGHMPEFLFVGSKTMIEICRQIALKRALSAKYIIGDTDSLPRGHLQHFSQIDTSKTTFVVYDTGAYSYETILSLFAEKPSERTIIATYDPTTQTIITPDEVITYTTKSH